MQLCEVGRLQTSQLPRKAPMVGDVLPVVDAVPARIVCGEPFAIQLSVSNFSKRNITLRLEDRTQTDDLILHMEAAKLVGPIAPGETLAVDVALLPVKTGLRLKHGLFLIDTATTAAVEIPMPELFIERRDS
eukprot:m.68696 g.68696  ORF g.68696 m.68696 type:complete len:132 (-) comp7513_c0_seq1:128-523(-)